MARQWFPARKRVCECDADVTVISSVITAERGKPKVLKQSQMVRHRTGDSYFWHWKDQTDLEGVPHE